MEEYEVTVYDIFSVGQKSIEGREFIAEFVERGGKIVNFAPTPEIISHIKRAGCIIDAVFGTGFHGDMPEDIRPLAIAVAESVEAYKIAIDVPLGINADNVCLYIGGANNLLAIAYLLYRKNAIS